MSRSLDHVVLPVADADAAARLFAPLGFQLAPDARHPFGTANACIFLRDGSYLEPLWVGEPDRYSAAVGRNAFVDLDRASRGRAPAPHLSALAIASADADGDAARLREAMAVEPRTLRFSRVFRDPRGEARELTFQLVFADLDATLPVFFCQPMHREAPDRSALTRHPNGAVRLARIHFSRLGPAAIRSLAEAIGTNRTGTEPSLDNCAVSTLSEPEFAAHFGATAACALVFAVTDLDRCAASITTGHSVRHGDRIVARLSDQLVFAFERDAA